MSSNSGVNATVRLPFPAAGVSFNIRVASPDIEGAVHFHLDRAQMGGGRRCAVHFRDWRDHR